MKRTKSTAAAAVHVKTADLRVKEAGPDDGLADGEFIAYASVFGNVDSYGEIVDETAFDRTLEEWKSSGDVIPVLWGHDTFDPFNNIGGVKEAVAIKSAAEKDAAAEMAGLKVHGYLDLDNPTAAQVYRLMKGRRTTKMSFAYAVREGADGDDGYHLKDLDLFEVSVVQIPANQEAEILTVKDGRKLVKSGRVLSAKNEASLRSARDAIDSVLKALDSESEDGADGGGKAGSPAGQEEASGDQTQTKAGSQTEEPPGQGHAPSEESKSGPSVETWANQFATMHAAFAAEGD